MFPCFAHLSHEVKIEILSNLDRASLNKFACTSIHSLGLAASIASGIMPGDPDLLQIAKQSMGCFVSGTRASALTGDFAGTSAGSPESPSNDDDTIGSSGTEMTSPEPEYEFKMTEEVMARVNALPNFIPDASLEGLPYELQLIIFGNLDMIDSVCLGLSNPRYYDIYRAIHGTKMLLSTRRPLCLNPLERAWEVVGKNACSHCGNFRCQLYEHIKSWMPNNLEYCQFSQKFGSRAREGVNPTCYRGKPSKPNRCGRHPIRTTTIHQDDQNVNRMNIELTN